MTTSEFSKIFSRKFALAGQTFELKFEPFPNNPKPLGLRAGLKRSKGGDWALIELEGQAEETQKKLMFGKVKLGYSEEKGFSDPIMQPEDLGFLGIESDRDHMQLMITVGKKDSYRFWLDLALIPKEEQPPETDGSEKADKVVEPKKETTPQPKPAPKKTQKKPEPQRKTVMSYGIGNGNYAIPKLFHLEFAPDGAVRFEEGLARFRRMSQTYLTHKAGANRIPLVWSALEFRYTPLIREDVSKVRAKSGQTVSIHRKPNQLWIIYPADKGSDAGKEQAEKLLRQLAFMETADKLKLFFSKLAKQPTKLKETAKYTLAVVEIPENKKTF